jgi:SOS-response transcriptional repressor LexA
MYTCTLHGIPETNWENAVKELTRRQTEVLDFIRDYIAEEHLPPAVADIARAFDFKSPNALPRNSRDSIEWR